MRHVWVIAALVFVGPPLGNRMAPAKGPTKTKVDKAIDRALEFLKNHQETTEGTWHGGRRGGSNDPAVTALAVMAFLSAGHLPGEGPYGATVEKGVRAVLTFQNRNGLFATRGQWELYEHGICTLMLAEVAGMTEDKKLAAEIKTKLVKAVQVILKAQRKPEAGENRGGWRYQVNGRDSDMSVTGWQIMALRAAKNLGCDVPAKSIEQAADYIKRSQDAQNGGFRYMERRGVTVPCTGTGILALEICGKDWHRSAASRRAGAYLLQHKQRWRSPFFSYGIYYCSQAMFQLGGNYWKSYQPHLHKVLLDNQNSINGSWNTGDGFGPSYDTAMAVLALTVEYRYLPIYQRDEGEEKTP
jgi:hypothetical protein